VTKAGYDLLSIYKGAHALRRYCTSLDRVTVKARSAQLHLSVKIALFEVTSVGDKV
jgi:hypothetical protein